MKHPFKITGLLIIAGAILFAAWPNHTVRDHNPVTGEGVPGEEHEHEHLDAPQIPASEEMGEVISQEDTQEK